MIDHMLDSLNKIHREPVPDKVWLGIQHAIERRRLQAIPRWMQVAAVLITLMLLGEIVSTFKAPTFSGNSTSNTYVFYQNNQWYHD